jgi:glutamate-ammonia-ligase adenylyltransferase
MNKADLDADAFVELSGYAREVLRHWKLVPDWLNGDQPADDPELAIELRLRRLRQLEALRIQWQEIAGRFDVEETGKRLSNLACRCLELALGAAESSVAERHGILMDASGRRAHLAVLALGKLGGDELNFNSDLDLVFCHEAVGESDGRRALGPRDYFGRVVRELARMMEEVTAYGRVWVIDTRLRPFGQAGAMVWSVSAMEQYFLNEGRAWERYAWLKARAVAGDLEVGKDLLARIAPFVFRRYLDYGLFDSLRSLHADIEQRSLRDDLRGDIKRGPGGIRELEFLIQSLQLLRGGREPGLRTTGFLPALRAARERGLLEVDEVDDMDSAYRFLRALENRLQVVTGRQTHELPDAADGRDALARLMADRDRASLAERTRRVRDRVRALFRARFESRAQRQHPESSPWPPDDQLEMRLAAAGFGDIDSVAAALRRLHQRLGRRPLSSEARQRLDRLMPELLEEAARHPSPETGFADLLSLIETVARRSAYLALLYERPATLARCIRVFHDSERLAHWITASPQLLDDLLAPDRNPELPSLPGLQPDDSEHNLNALGRYRQAGFVRTALGQLEGVLDRPVARERLTRLAETVLERIAEMFLPRDASIAIIGYGNLGAGELHYTSDLDLVFLHDHGEAPLRSVQRMINALQLPLHGGKLYEVDTRLRPNGNAGMLVSSMDSFADYQDEYAWTWEHQALIRARCVFGPAPIRERFEHIRRDVLARSRPQQRVRVELAAMRRRQLEQRRESPVKRVLGDIQFIAELGVLLNAEAHPGLLDARATSDQLDRLIECGWLEAASGGELAEVFREAASLRDRLFLERACSEVLPPESVNAVRRVWASSFERGER